MKHASIDQLQALIDSLDDVSLSAGVRVEILQQIRQTAAGLYLKESRNCTSNGEQVDAMVLRAIDVALLPFEQQSCSQFFSQSRPAAEYSQP